MHRAAAELGFFSVRYFSGPGILEKLNAAERKDIHSPGASMLYARLLWHVDWK